MFGRGPFGVVVGIVLVLAIAAGAAYLAYGAGLTSGMAQAGGGSEGGQPGLAAPYFYAPYRFHPFGYGFGLVGCLVPLLVFFLLLSFMRMLFWPRRWGWGPGWRHHGHGEHEDWPQWMQDKAERWHRRMHGEQPEPPDESKT